jgi:hypothetical protein
MLRFTVHGGPPNANDRLIVRDDVSATWGKLRWAVDDHGSRATVAVFNTSLGDVVYDEIERLDVLPVDPAWRHRPRPDNARPNCRPDDPLS